MLNFINVAFDFKFVIPRISNSIIFLEVSFNVNKPSVKILIILRKEVGFGTQKKSKPLKYMNIV